jgi:hypothetical protein
MTTRANETMEFDSFLKNSTHDWLSIPYSMHGWRLSGRRRVRGCYPADTYHAGIDYIGFHTNYLEPAIGFLINGERPELDSQSWTPSELSATYKQAPVVLAIKCALPDTDELLFVATVTNDSDSVTAFDLTAYGEADRRIDPEDSVDIDVQGGGHKKNFYSAIHRRLSDRSVITECISEMGESHRGGFTRYDLFRICNWHYAHTGNTFAIDLPEGGSPADADGGWKQSWKVSLAAGEKATFTFRLAGKYQARQRLDDAAMAELADTARAMRSMDYDQALGDTIDYWQDLLENVPAPAPELGEELIAMYYRAWVCVWQIVTPGFDTGRMDGLTFPEACTLVTKADHRASMPAEWETGLAALLISQMDAELGRQILDSVLAAVEPDGFVPECLVVTKENMLPCTTPYFQWAIYEKTGDKEWLAKHYDAQKRSFWAHYRQPNFKRRGNPTLRNLAYTHIGAIYMCKIAEELDLPNHEVKCAKWLVNETRQIVQNFWDEERNQFCSSINERPGDPGGEGFVREASIQSMVTLFAGADDDQIPHLLKDLKEKYMVGDYGFCEIGSEGGSAPGAALQVETDLSKMNTYKHSNFMYFIPGLAKADPELCREVCLRTVKGIALNGDFHEQMKCNMEGKAFGPMSGFGAFGYITCAQMLGRLGMPQQEK